jgi:hypothetical protein
MKPDRDELAELFERLGRDEGTTGIVAALLSLFGLIGFVSAVAWFAYH